MRIAFIFFNNFVGARIEILTQLFGADKLCQITASGYWKSNSIEVLHIETTYLWSNTFQSFCHYSFEGCWDVAKSIGRSFLSEGLSLTSQQWQIWLNGNLARSGKNIQTCEKHFVISPVEVIVELRKRKSFVLQSEPQPNFMKAQDISSLLHFFFCRLAPACFALSYFRLQFFSSRILCFFNIFSKF